MLVNNTIDISVVIPCYNSEQSLPALMDRLVSTLNTMALNYEIILVDDVSKDNTAQTIHAATKKHANVVGIELMNNVGQFIALMCGLEHSKGDYVITMDDDLQHAPEDIPSLYKHLQDNLNCDAVLAIPKIKQHSLFREIGSLFVKKIHEIVFNKPRHLQMSSFRCLTRNLVNAMTSCKTKYPITGLLILSITPRIDAIIVKHHPRYHGKSNYSLYKLLSVTASNIINFSSLPLKIISFIGFSVSAISFVLSILYIYQYLSNDLIISGFTTTIVLVNFYGGLCLLSIGIIGEYINRILQEVNGNPRYKIRKIL